MKVLKYQQDNYKLFGYKRAFTAYGCIKSNGKQKYSLEYVIPFATTAIKIYSRPEKPLIRNLLLLDILAIIPSIIISLVAAVLIAAMFIINYPYEILIKKSFFTQTWELLSGWLWVVLGVYGIIRIFI